MQTDISLNTRQQLQRAIAAIRAGRPVIVLDDENREDEADLIMAAELVSASWMARFIRDCSGIVCLCLDNRIADRLELPLMVSDNGSRHGTPFTVSIEARHGVTTGVSAADRTVTVLTACAENARAEDLVRPGHIFPLRAHDRRVHGRRGHTEGAVMLAELAGLRPAAILCELMNDDGTMMRGAQLRDYAARNDLVVTSIAALADYPD
ncbi:3,4-dihydroxy-2-butanone-4-phosphate synthase [Azonexus sp. R2A61]|uniref:3,4-dihydroxy-2-butanone-4-phosphate synthase n=1 Tax=Azonexus sp. R2A61 TaxID=2744443 RepID=UPI001EFFD2A7|nr:3,4-dihydroxy-2-butanone-4-phosphate synthase [Azonexus sp. R2A61]